jgi:hypothetical protein
MPTENSRIVPDSMDDLISNLSLAPTNEEELDAKKDVALILWSHLTDAGRNSSWEELSELRMKASEWAAAAEI